MSAKPGYPNIVDAAIRELFGQSKCYTQLRLFTKGAALRRRLPAGFPSQRCKAANCDASGHAVRLGGKEMFITILGNESATARTCHLECAPDHIGCFERGSLKRALRGVGQ